jgi:hypothetical protein
VAMEDEAFEKANSQEDFFICPKITRKKKNQKREKERKKLLKSFGTYNIGYSFENEYEEYSLISVLF